MFILFGVGGLPVGTAGKSSIASFKAVLILLLQHGWLVAEGATVIPVCFSVALPTSPIPANISA